MKESKILILGNINSAIKKSIRALLDMKVKEEKIYLSIRPVVEVQKDICKQNSIKREEVGINLILNKEDFQEYIVHLKA